MCKTIKPLPEVIWAWITYWKKRVHQWSHLQARYRIPVIGLSHVDTLWSRLFADAAYFKSSMLLEVSPHLYLCKSPQHTQWLRCNTFLISPGKNLPKVNRGLFTTLKSPITTMYFVNVRKALLTALGTGYSEIMVPADLGSSEDWDFWLIGNVCCWVFDGGGDAVNMFSCHWLRKKLL